MSSFDVKYVLIQFALVFGHHHQRTSVHLNPAFYPFTELQWGEEKRLLQNKSVHLLRLIKKQEGKS